MTQQHNLLTPKPGDFYIADCLTVLERMPDEILDGVFIDPPFGKARTFKGTLIKPLDGEEIAAENRFLSQWGINTKADADGYGVTWPDDTDTTNFRDLWTWRNHVHGDWLKTLDEHAPNTALVVKCAKENAGNQIGAYIAWMAIRCWHIHRVSKTTAWFTYHCDSTANGYIRPMLDSIWGSDGFVNELTWRRKETPSGSQHSANRIGVLTDTIFIYRREHAGKPNTFRPRNEAEIKSHFPLVDENGDRYFDDTKSIYRAPSMAPRPNLCYEWRGFTNLNPSGWRLSKERMEEEYSKGNIVILDEGDPDERRIQRRAYAKNSLGLRLGNLITDIKPLTNAGPDGEKTGYPTQKPIALLERLLHIADIETGAIIGDFFGGCSTSIIAAQNKGINWITCDVNVRGWTMTQRQFPKQGYELVLAGTTSRLNDKTPVNCRVLGPQYPQQFDRATLVMPDYHPPEPIETRDALLLSEPLMLELLLASSGWQCWGCGYHVRNQLGELRQDRRYFHLDHVNPKSAGGSDEIINRAPLCPPCNGDKSDDMNLNALRNANNSPAINRQFWGGTAPSLRRLTQVQERLNRHFETMRSRTRLARTREAERLLKDYAELSKIIG